MRNYLVLILLICILMPTQIFAGALVKVRSLGSSYKGKYIAVEEYGYHPGNVPYSRIRVIDVWKDKEMMNLEMQSSKSNLTLQQIRNKTLLQAREKALKYKIQF